MGISHLAGGSGDNIGMSRFEREGYPLSQRSHPFTILTSPLAIF